MDADPGRLSFGQAVAIVTHVAERAGQVAAGLHARREPEAEGLVAGLAQEAGRAALALRQLAETTPRDTDWYEVHRDMWIRYGDPGDLTAMTNQVTEPL